MRRFSFIVSIVFMPVPVLSLGGCDNPTDDLPEVEPNDDHYGPCTDTYGRVLCRPDEDGCLSFPFDASSHYSCSAPCDVDADCPDPPADSAPVVRCIEDTCQLRCAGGGVCPLGMDCPDDITCLWPID